MRLVGRWVGGRAGGRAALPLVRRAVLAPLPFLLLLALLPLLPAVSFAQDLGTREEQELPDLVRLRWEFFYEKRAFPFDRIPAGALERARAQAAGLRMSALRAAPPPFSGSQWTPLGPEGFVTSLRSIGRISAVAVDPTNSSVIYVGGAQGGVWKTTDGGASWTPKSDKECSLAMGWIAIDPVNTQILYAGTGEQHFSGDSYYGCGLLRSTDGGDSWTQLGKSIFQTSSGGARIARVVIDPSTAGTVATTRIYVASDFGLYRSTDGGTTLAQVLGGTITDVVIDPTTPATLYAASYGVGVYRSDNSGTTWSLKSTGFATSMGRINLAIAPSASDTLYASIQRGGGSDLGGIYRTTDGAATWSQVAASGASCAQQCWYDMAIAVQPDNPNVVYFGGLYMYKSTDGGTSFSTVGGIIHVDQHVITFDPANAQTLFVGNDGGIFKGTSGGSSWSSLNSNLQLTQFYEGISLHPWDPNGVLGGTQDNGTLAYSGSADWTPVIGGDGGYTGIDFQNPLTQYGETQWAASSGYSGPRRSDGGGFNLRTTGINLADRALFIPPLVMDRVDPQVLYFGTYRIYRTANRGDSWTTISSDLTGGSGAISAIAPAPADPQRIYVGTSNGRVQTTDDGGATWTLRTLPISARYVQAIAVDPRDPLTAYLVVSGFGTPHVFRTTDGGASFQSASGGLPDTPVNAVVVDPTSRGPVLVGADVGAFMSSDSGGTWTQLGTGMPNVAIYDLAYNASTGSLIAATHGRGMFRLQLDRPLTLAVVPGAIHDTIPASGGTIANDSATVVLTGTGAASAGWSATHTAASWITLTASSGTGSGRLRWTRNPSGLTPGVYVDTITVTSAGAIDSPWLLLDSTIALAPLTVIVTPASRNDTAFTGSTTPVPDSATVTITGDGATAAQWLATHGAGAWLTLTTTNGTGSGVVRWRRDPTGLAAGTYVDTITVAVGGALGSPQRVVDTLVVIQSLTLAVQPTSKADTAPVGSTTVIPDSASVSITGTGAASSTWSATHGAGAWLTLTTAAGTASGVLRWERDPSGLTPGVYVDTLSVTVAGAVGSPARLVDTLLIEDVPTLALATTGRRTTTFLGSTTLLPDSTAVELSGTGTASLAWSATHGAATWLTLTTAAGVGSGTLRWSRDPTGLAVGTYVDTLTLTASVVVGSPTRFFDTLVVRNPPALLALAPTARRDSLSVGTTASQPDSAAVTQTGFGADTTQWTATHGAAGWLTLTAGAGAGSGMLRWSRNAAGLGEGVYVDTLRVTTSQGEQATLRDTLAVIPPPLLLSAAARSASGTSAATVPSVDSVDLVLRGVGNTTATWTATHGAGAWLTIASAAGTGSGRVRWTRSAATLRPGTYTDAVVVATSRGDTARVVDTFVITAPAVATACAANELLGAPCLDDAQRRYLDLDGNQDGTYNLGDLLALLTRTATATTAERRR